MTHLEAGVCILWANLSHVDTFIFWVARTCAEPYQPPKPAWQVHRRRTESTSSAVSRDDVGVIGPSLHTAVVKPSQQRQRPSRSGIPTDVVAAKSQP